MTEKENCLKKPLRKLYIDSMPDDPGVYGFWCAKTGRCIYIGKTEGDTQSIRKRVEQQWRKSANETLAAWIRHFGEYLEICYLRAPYGKIDALETRLIHLWNPEANIYKRKKQ